MIMLLAVYFSVLFPLLHRSGYYLSIGGLVDKLWGVGGP